jgi:hypothetical protein
MSTFTATQISFKNSLGHLLRTSRLVQMAWLLFVVASSSALLFLEYRFDLMKDITAVWSTGTAITLVGTLVPLALAHVDVRLRGQTWTDLGLRRPRRPLLALLLVPVLLGAGLLLSAALSALPLPVNNGPPNVNHLSNIPGNLPGFLWAMVVMWASAAFAEEVLFRGYLLTRLTELFGKQAAGWIAAIIIGALLFGLSHFYQGPVGIVGTGVTGLVLGAGYWLGGRNLWPLIIAHGLGNSLGFTMLFLGG